MFNIKENNSESLLKLYSEILTELNSRGVLRTGNNPAGDLAEHLFCKAFGWKIASNSKAGFDAINSNSAKIQIKSRKLKNDVPGERLLSDFRDLKSKKFDYLAGIIFNTDFSIYKAAIMPHKIVINFSSYSKHTNAHKFYLRDNLWDLEDTKDVTQELIKAFKSL